MRALIEYSHSQQTREWTRRHALGEVPDALPYGLNWLEDSGITPVTRDPLPAGPWKTVARAMRRGGYQWVEAARSPTTPDIDMALCWDERSGVPRAARDAKRIPVASGVLWITDHVKHPAHRAAMRALRRCALIWVHARPQRDQLIAEGFPASSVEFLNFAVDAEFFTRPADGEREPGLIVSAGNDRDRDWYTLLRAFSAVRRHVPGARLEIATRAHLPPQDGVRVRANVSHQELRDAYARAWCVVVPTRPNLHLSGLTNTLESKAMEVPVVLSATPGADDYVSPGVNGFLYRPGDDDDLAAQLTSALQADLASVREMGAAGRQDVDRQQNTRHHAATLAGLLLSRL